MSIEVSDDLCCLSLPLGLALPCFCASIVAVSTSIR